MGRVARFVVVVAVAACSRGSRATSGDDPAARATGTSASTDAAPGDAPAPRETCAAQRAHFTTHLIGEPPPREHAPPPVPSDPRLQRVHYPAPLGPLWAYVGVDPHDGKRHPAVVWAHGGFDFGIDDFFSEHGPPDNDQSARGFADAGLVIMYPSYRGTHDNPGRPELLYGEVDDYLAAVEYVRALPYVDPDHVYLAGHSTGGSLVVLAAALTDHYRAAFAFGPIDWIRSYGQAPPFDPQVADDSLEWRLRSPAWCVADVRRPIWITEGTEQGNGIVLGRLANVAGDAPLHRTYVQGATHFSVLAPAIARLAAQIGDDTGPEPRFSLDHLELPAP